VGQWRCRHAPGHEMGQMLLAVFLTGSFLTLERQPLYSSVVALAPVFYFFVGRGMQVERVQVLWRAEGLGLPDGRSGVRAWERELRPR